jgi:hypothetical protein
MASGLGTQEPFSRPAPASGEDGSRTSVASRRWLAMGGCVLGSLALGAVYLRISLSDGVTSDFANNALQAWDLLHGNLLLHGWLTGHANFYFLELPLNAFTAAVFGLGNFAAHVASAITYLLVTVCAVALATADTRGPARVVRGAAALVALTAPLIATTPVVFLLGEPDHVGTSVFIFATFLLADRVPERRFTAPLVCVILVAGQFDDLTVRYVAVPAIVVVCGYRALAARRLRSPDAALVAAAIASVPLTTLLNLVVKHLGGFSTAPSTAIAPIRLWPHQAAITWANLRLLYGAIDGPQTKLGALGFVFAAACLLAAVAGLAWAAWPWRQASRTDRLLCVAIACNVAGFWVSTLAWPGNAHEMAVVVPCGAVLAARLVPARIPSVPAAFAAVAVTGLAAVLTLTSAATLPENPGFSVPLTRWLEQHRLTYGLATYWDASAATLQSGGRVMILTANLGWRSRHGPMGGANYEDQRSWYDPSLHDATFVVADATRFPAATIEKVFGKPAWSHRLDQWTILIYGKNLLGLLGGASGFSSLSVGGTVAPPREPPPEPVREVAEHRGGRRERRHRADDREQPRHGGAERPPAAGQAAGEPRRRRRLVVPDHGLGLRPEDGDRDRGVGGLVVQRALFGLQGLQVGFLAVDLLLDGEQVRDRAGVPQQRAQLSDRRLV